MPNRNQVVGAASDPDPGRGIWVASAALLLLAAAPAAAGVEFSISPEPYYVGAPITVTINVSNEPTHQPPTLPDIDGAEVRMGPESKRSQISIGTGMKQTVIESVTYAIEIIPRRAGRLEIPPVALVVAGKPERTSPKVVQVEKSDADDLLFALVHADRDSIYLGESLDLRLEIWLRPMKNQQANFGDYNDMWQCVDTRRSAWGPFATLLQDTRNIRVDRQVRKGADGANREYFVYRLNRTWWPEQAGTLDLGDINVMVEYPLQVDRDRSMFSFFNEPRVLRSRPVSAAAVVDPIMVKPVPTQGQPPGYSGAVGRFEFETDAKPTEVHVGDPITLTLALRGGGRLDLLQPPKLEEVEDLVKRFKMPSDPLAGVVEGNVKRFTQTLRARDATVTEIPALPFSYFDPKAETFGTVRSRPIPLKVAESDRLSVSEAVEAETGPRVSTRLTRHGEGILANYSNIDLLLAQQGFSPGPATVAWLASPPLAFLASVVVRRRRERRRNDVGFARRQSARGSALRRLQQAAAARDPQEAAARVGAALSDYVADRRGLPSGALTRAEIADELRQCRARAETVRLVDAVLGDCEDLRYAGGTAAHGDAPWDRARQCIHALESERL